MDLRVPAEACGGRRGASDPRSGVAVAMTKQMHGTTRTTSRTHSSVGRTTRPHDSPTIAPEPEAERMPDRPFEEGAHDAIGSDLRHRLISAAAFRRYVERGYVDGFDVEDWLQAEAEIDHELIGAPRA